MLPSSYDKKLHAYIKEALFTYFLFFFVLFWSMGVNGMGLVDQSISSLIFTEKVWITVVFALFVFVSGSVCESSR